MLQNSRTGRGIQGLQFVRANAVLLVVFCHSAAVLGLHEYFDSQFLGGLLNKGAVGVDIFFVLSGFIIVHVALERRTLTPRTNLKDFLLKRFVRIYPFLWVAVIVYAGLRYIGAREFEWLPYLNSVTLFPVGEVRPNVVWSLRHEILFYLLFAFSFLMKRKAPYLVYVWCAAPTALQLLSHSVGLQLPDNDLFGFVFNRANALFGCGVLVGITCKRYGLPRGRVGGTPAFWWVVVMLASAACFVLRDWMGVWAVAIAATTVVVVALITPASQSMFAEAWSFLGDASYSIYLTHNIILLVGAKGWVFLWGPSAYVPAIFILGALAVAGGSLAHVFVEKPIIAYATRRLFQQKPLLERV